MGLLDSNYSAVNGKKPRNSGRLFAGEELNGRGLLDAATNIPVVGDALSGGMAIYDAAKGDYGSAAMNALGVLPFVSGSMVAKGSKVADAVNGKKLTEFEQRHLTAQKNAALPVEQGGLGLPADNTAMQRADILFPERGFHATGSDIKNIDPARIAESDYGTIGQGFYIDPREGAGYSNLVAKINANKSPQNIMPLRYNADDLYDVSDLVGVRDAASSARMTSNLKDAGYSGTVSRTMDGLPSEVAIFDPSKVRSRFAAFDPMRRHEADLLGYADPRLLAGIAGGGLLGLGGYSLMGDK